MTDKKYIEQLKSMVSNYTNIPESQWHKLLPHLFEKSLNKNEPFIQFNAVPDSIAFIISGIFRVYYTTENGIEKTLIFRHGNQFISAYTSFLTNKKSPYTIQAITDSIIVYIPINVYVELAKNHICWNELSGRYAEQLFIEKETREKELLLLDAKQRYINFKKKYSHIIKNIPNYMIASYLGITPESLSRIKRKIEIKK